MVYRNTPEYEDVFQEVWIAGWRSAQQNPSRGYIAKSMLNRGNDARRGARLGSSRTNHGGRGRLLVHSVQHSYPDFLEPSRDDNYPSDLDWATRVAPIYKETGSVAATAKAVGINTCTIYRWLSNNGHLVRKYRERDISSFKFQNYR